LETQESASFLKKKKQKTFDSRGRWRGWCLNPQDQSFFASFCLQKEVLTPLSTFPNSL
jgi:hypothetical protein